MFLETARSRADQERLRRPPPGVRHVAGGWGKSTPSHQPGALGSFLGVKAKPLRGRCASLDPHPLRQCPSSPCAGLWRVFEWRAGQGVGAARSPAGARTRPLDATGATQACRQGVGGALPRHPCPSAKAPGRVAGRRLIRRAVQGAPPAWGSRGAQPLGLAQRTKTLCRRRGISALRASLFGSSRPPEGGLNLETEGEPRKATNSGVLGFPM